MHNVNYDKWEFNLKLAQYTQFIRSPQGITLSMST